MVMLANQKVEGDSKGNREPYHSSPHALHLILAYQPILALTPSVVLNALTYSIRFVTEIFAMGVHQDGRLIFIWTFSHLAR
jgi:hypothetical protein